MATRRNWQPRQASVRFLDKLTVLGAPCAGSQACLVLHKAWPPALDGDVTLFVRTRGECSRPAHGHGPLTRPLGRTQGAARRQQPQPSIAAGSRVRLPSSALPCTAWARAMRRRPSSAAPPLSARLPRAEVAKSPARGPRTRSAAWRTGTRGASGSAGRVGGPGTAVRVWGLPREKAAAVQAVVQCICPASTLNAQHSAPGGRCERKAALQFSRAWQHFASLASSARAIDALARDRSASGGETRLYAELPVPSISTLRSGTTDKARATHTREVCIQPSPRAFYARVALLRPDHRSC